MNWITISVALTVFVCISFDNGYVTALNTTVKTTLSTAKPVTVSTVVVPTDGNSGNGGSGTGYSDGMAGGTNTDDNVTNNAQTGTTDKLAHDGGTNNVNNGTTDTDGNGNGGSGAGELSAKVLMIATMAGYTLAAYSAL